MDLSIVIVSFNTKDITRNCLVSVYKSLAKSPLQFEVIVVDNGSNDGTREIIASKFPKVKTIFNTDNVGFGRANNQGIKFAKGDYILLLNSDTLILNNAIEKLVAFAKLHPNTFIGPKLLNLDMTPQSSCGPFFSLPVVFASLFLQGDRLGLTRWSPDRVRRVDWVSGACILGQKKLFMQNLMFDEKIFMYMEEIDLLIRARQKGFKTYFYPKAHIVHLGAGSSTNRTMGPVLNIYRGFLYLYKKHGTPTSFAIVRFFLKTKAVIAWCAGVVLGKSQLKETYAQAYQMV